jgi:hypothetical protein
MPSIFNREARATVGRRLRSTYEADSSRPLPDSLARLLDPLGQDSFVVIEAVHDADREGEKR